MTLVSARSLSKRFGDLEVLKGVSLDVASGERVAILGRSGSGKSTFLRCLNGLERINGGALIVAGIDLAAPSPDLKALRRRVGIVFQSFNLFPHSPSSTTSRSPSGRYSSDPPPKQRASPRRCCRKSALPTSSTRPSELSGGQQQRVAIARSLALAPSLMLFDEITSALDPELIGEVVGVLERLAKGDITMVVVTHQLGFARSISTRVVFMHQGQILEDGPTEKVLNTPQTSELRAFLSAVLT